MRAYVPDVLTGSCTWTPIGRLHSIGSILAVLSLFSEQAAAALESRRLLDGIQASFAELKSMQDRLVRGERLRVIGELSSGVAHEFNNLLTSILARVQMMSLGTLPSHAREDLELIERAALDAAEVVRRLQSFSRNQRQVDFKIVDIGAICQDAVDLLRPLWRQTSAEASDRVEVRLRSEPELMVRGDPTELREVVTNLLKNALEAIPAGGRITISATRRRGRLNVSVRDTGSGIPPEVIGRVCDPFFTTKGERGTGLGLCLSQQIIERHGGKITVTSPPDAGTTVSFTLPEFSENAPTTAPAATPVAPVPSFRGRVLVVDDDSLVLEPVCAYLARMGFQVARAQSGEEALELLALDVPSVVLSDVGMPGMSGLDLCRRVHELYPGLPVVLMSGWASDVDPARARAAGASDVLPKPFPMDRATKLLAQLASENADGG